MKPLLIYVCLFAFPLNVLDGQDAANKFQENSGASVFQDGTDKIIGIEIPGYGNGFERSIVIDDSMKQWFDSSKPVSTNGGIELGVAFAESPDRLTGLKNFPDLKWIIYKGGRFWPPQPDKTRNNEEGRVSVVIHSIQDLKELQGLLIYDTTLPIGGLEKIVSLERLKAIELINCELKTRVGSYSKLPDMKMIRTKENEELRVIIHEKTNR